MCRIMRRSRAWRRADDAPPRDHKD